MTVPPVKCLRTSWPPGAPPYCIVYELLVRPVHHAVEDLSFLLVQALQAVCQRGDCRQFRFEISRIFHSLSLVAG